jgi:hypothetical protein
MRSIGFGLVALLLASPARALGLVEELTPPQPDVSSFGHAVALSGSRLVVGDPNHGAYPNFQRGAVFVYELGANGFAYQDLLPGHPMNQGRLGASVALDGDIVVASEPGAMKVFVYGWSSGVWSEQTQIDVAPLTNYAVAVSGDTCAIGRDGEWNGSAYSGAVHVERQNGSTWAEEATLVASNASAAGLGHSVALEGDTLLAGAPAGGADVGRAFVFVRSASTWTEQAELAPPSVPSGLYGTAVALDADTAVIGDPIIVGKPSVYVFVRAGTAWSLQATLTAPVAGDTHFGQALAISGDRLVVGAPQTNSGVGAAYLYERSGVTWGAPVPIDAADVGANDHFGTSVSVDSTHVAVGAPDHGTAASFGAVYVYDLTTGTGGSGGAAGAGGGAGATASGGAAGAAGSSPSGGTGAGVGIAGSSGVTGGAGAGGTPNAGLGGAGALAGSGNPSGANGGSANSGGCGCSTPQRTDGASWLSIAIALGAFGLRRRALRQPTR